MNKGFLMRGEEGTRSSDAVHNKRNCTGYSKASSTHRQQTAAVYVNNNTCRHCQLHRQNGSIYVNNTCRHCQRMTTTWPTVHAHTNYQRLKSQHAATLWKCRWKISLVSDYPSFKTESHLWKHLVLFLGNCAALCMLVHCAEVLQAFFSCWCSRNTPVLLQMFSPPQRWFQRHNPHQAGSQPNIRCTPDYPSQCEGREPWSKYLKTVRQEGSTCPS